MFTEFMKQLLVYVGWFYVLYLIGYATFLFLSVVVGSSDLYKRRREEQLKNEFENQYNVPITVVVPAYNEGLTVADTVHSLLELDYKLLEIVVVDDGSKDDTVGVLVKEFNMMEIQRPIYRRVPCQQEKKVYWAQVGGIDVTLVQKANGGKADALNMGINVSKYPYFICMDADSFLQRDSLTYIVQPLLESDDVVASGGLVRISNGITIEDGYVKEYHMPKNLLVCMQILEYDRSFLASRIFMDRFNGNLIISGAFGLFRKDIVVDAGGYDTNTMGEDMELVVKLHVFCRQNQIPYRIRYAPDAICWSQAPTTLGDLKKQRKRWHIGLFQSMWKYRQIFANSRFGLVSLVSYLYFVVYELLSPYIELFGLVTILLAMAVNLINVPYMLLYFAIYAVFGGVLTLTAFFSRIHTQNLKLTVRDIAKAVLLCVVEIVALRFALASTRMTALLGYKKKKHSWGQIKRVRNQKSS